MRGEVETERSSGLESEQRGSTIASVVIGRNNTVASPSLFTSAYVSMAGDAWLRRRCRDTDV
jgi:hypothetical protein